MTALRPILLLLTALSIPTAFAADSALMSKGQKIYETNCAACHGKKGEGRGTMFPPLFQAVMVTMMRKVQMKLLAMSQKWRMLARKLFKSSTYLVKSKRFAASRHC